MTDTELFQVALGLSGPWHVVSSDFDVEFGRLRIRLDFKPGAKFACPDCGASATAHDTVEKSWRHLNFFQHATELVARTPRIDCPNCGARLVEVPWARPGSGFTALFEAYCMTLAKDMPVRKIAELVGEHDTLVWRIIRHHVGEARAKEDYSQVKELGVDETSARKGHNYITIFVDMDKAKVIFATPGKDGSTFKGFKTDFEAKKGLAANVSELSMDMSAAFIAGARAEFPNASVTFDKFHCVALLNEAVEKVRREEAKFRPELKGSRWVWLRNVDTMSDSQQSLLDELSTPKLNLKTAKAYQIKLLFQDIYTLPAELAEAALEKWHRWASRCKLEPLEKAAKTVKEHWDGILRWFDSRLNNGVVECINGLIQTVKRRARGFRNMENFIAMIYLQCGKLKLNTLPT